LDAAALHGGFADTAVAARWLDEGIAANGASGRVFTTGSVHGFDLTFAAPKSVSLLRALTDDIGEKAMLVAHHLPSNRYPEIAERVRALCVTYDLPYTTGPLLRQHLLTVRTICKLALPDRFLFATSVDALETASENRFRNAAERSHVPGVGNDVRRRGLATAILTRCNRRQPRDRSAWPI
jgi:hypothetical protein